MWPPVDGTEWGGGDAANAEGPARTPVWGHKRGLLLQGSAWRETSLSLLDRRGNRSQSRARSRGRPARRGAGVDRAYAVFPGGAVAEIVGPAAARTPLVLSAA